MHYPRKLRNEFRITGFIPAIVCICIGALIWIFIGPEEGVYAVSAFFVLYSFFPLWIFFRTRNQIYLAASVWQLYILYKLNELGLGLTY